MKIRFDHPATVLVVCQAGDEIHVAKPSPALANLLTSTRADGRSVARVVPDDDVDEEVADADDGDPEMAVTGRGRRGGKRAAIVP